MCGARGPPGLCRLLEERSTATERPLFSLWTQETGDAPLLCYWVTSTAWGEDTNITHTHTNAQNPTTSMCIKTHWKRLTLPHLQMHTWDSPPTTSTHKHIPESSKWLNICIYCCSNYPPVFLFCSFICGWRQVCVRFNESETGSVISLALPAVSFSLRYYSKKEQKKRLLWGP